jgi:uncharacterized membrane protein
MNSNTKINNQLSSILKTIITYVKTNNRIINTNILSIQKGNYLEKNNKLVLSEMQGDIEICKIDLEFTIAYSMMEC